MIDTVVIQPGADTGEPSVAGVSWAAVTAGAIGGSPAGPSVFTVPMVLELLLFGRTTFLK